MNNLSQTYYFTPLGFFLRGGFIFFGFTYIFISHDLAVVRYMADQLLVMNDGRIVESGEADQLYENPQNDYTQKLIAAIPKGI